MGRGPSRYLIRILLLFPISFPSGWCHCGQLASKTFILCPLSLPWQSFGRLMRRPDGHLGFRCAYLESRVRGMLPQGGVYSLWSESSIAQLPNKVKFFFQKNFAPKQTQGTPPKGRALLLLLDEFVPVLFHPGFRRGQP